jgi:hypothetical protein
VSVTRIDTDWLQVGGAAARVMAQVNEWLYRIDRQIKIWRTSCCVHPSWMALDATSFGDYQVVVMERHNLKL